MNLPLSSSATRPTKFSFRLMEETDRNRREVEALKEVQNMLHGKVDRATYVRFLMDLYHIVWNFCPIMAAAASRCLDKFSEVRYHLYYNIDEEKGHESMVLDDLSTFGIDTETVKATSPNSAAQAMIAYNYFMVDRVHPCAVLGMLYVLEIISSVYGRQVATSIAFGLDMPLPNGFTFLDSHASMDLDHMENLRKVLDTITDADIQNTIISSARMNFYLFSMLFANR